MWGATSTPWTEPPQCLSWLDPVANSAPLSVPPHSDTTNESGFRWSERASVLAPWFPPGTRWQHQLTGAPVSWYHQQAKPPSHSLVAMALPPQRALRQGNAMVGFRAVPGPQFSYGLQAGHNGTASSVLNHKLEPPHTRLSHPLIRRKPFNIYLSLRGPTPKAGGGLGP